MRLTDLLNLNRKMAKLKYLDSGMISEDDFKNLLQIDPTPQKKYMFWMAKQMVLNNINIDNIRNSILLFHTFVSRRVIDQQYRDIYKFKSFELLTNVLDDLNQRKSALLVSAKDEYETLHDDLSALVVRPDSFLASRKMGLSKFAFRWNSLTNQYDSNWCTTFSNRGHWDDVINTPPYMTLYYVLIRGDASRLVIDKFGGSRYCYLAVVVSPEGEHGSIEAVYDGDDHTMSISRFKQIAKIAGIDYLIVL